MGDHALPPGDWKEGDHVPHVVSWQFLLGILMTLLFLTFITVVAAKVDLGSTINVGLALAIATVKATLVAAFFMHLYWDKPINTVILLFSLVLLALFLSFSLLLRRGILSEEGTFSPSSCHAAAETQGEQI